VRPFHLLVLVAVLAACGNPSHAELLRAHEAPDGEYRILYLDPPWSIMETDGAYVRLEVEANGVRFGDIDADVIPPKYLLEVSAPSGDAEDQIRRDERRARSDGDEIIRPATEAVTTSGAMGWDLNTSRLTSDGSRFSRVIYLDRTSGVVRLSFGANSDLRHPEVDAMIADVLVDPE